MIVDPAATTALLPTSTGATRVELEPTNASFPMVVVFFVTLLKLHVIVPAPMFVRDPICSRVSTQDRFMKNFMH